MDWKDLPGTIGFINFQHPENCVLSNFLCHDNPVRTMTNHQWESKPAMDWNGLVTHGHWGPSSLSIIHYYPLLVNLSQKLCRGNLITQMLKAHRRTDVQSSCYHSMGFTQCQRSTDHYHCLQKKTIKMELIREMHRPISINHRHNPHATAILLPLHLSKVTIHPTHLISQPESIPVNCHVAWKLKKKSRQKENQCLVLCPSNCANFHVTITQSRTTNDPLTWVKKWMCSIYGLKWYGLNFHDIIKHSIYIGIIQDFKMILHPIDVMSSYVKWSSPNNYRQLSRHGGDIKKKWMIKPMLQSNMWQGCNHEFLHLHSRLACTVHISPEQQNSTILQTTRSMKKSVSVAVYTTAEITTSDHAMHQPRRPKMKNCQFIPFTLTQNIT